MNFKSKVYWYYSKFILRKIRKKEGLSPSFFILSTGRSGSTLLRKLLMQGKQVHIPPESNDWIPAIIVLFSKYQFKNWEYRIKIGLEVLKNDSAFSYWEIDTKSFKKQLSQLPKKKRNAVGFMHTLYQLHAEIHNNEAQLIGDKTPYLSLQLPWLKLYNPKAKYIHIKRDPRAVIASRMKVFNETIEESLSRWLDTMKEIDHSNIQNTKSYLDLYYEDLVQHPQRELKKVCDFLKIEFTDEMLENKRLDLGDTVLEHHEQTKKPINKSALTKWKKELSQEQIERIEKFTKPYFQYNE